MWLDRDDPASPCGLRPASVAGHDRRAIARNRPRRRAARDPGYNPEYRPKYSDAAGCGIRHADASPHRDFTQTPARNRRPDHAGPDPRQGGRGRRDPGRRQHPPSGGAGRAADQGAYRAGNRHFPRDRDSRYRRRRAERARRARGSTVLCAEQRHDLGGRPDPGAAPPGRRLGSGADGCADAAASDSRSLRLCRRRRLFHGYRRQAGTTRRIPDSALRFHGQPDPESGSCSTD